MMMKTILVVLMASALFFSAGRQDRVTFVDKGVEKCALKSGDRNGDGVLSREEADALEVLNLTPYRIDIFEVGSYADLKQFPHLKQVWLGDSEVQELDLSANYQLEMVCVQSEALKVLTLAVGCAPKLAMPNREGELVVRRKYSENDPNSIWYR
jgi:hypothetical protein